MDIKEFLVFDYNNILCKQISWLGINIVSLSSVLISIHVHNVGIQTQTPIAAKNF